MSDLETKVFYSMYIAMVFFCQPKPYVNFGDLSKMMITILPEPVALVGWSPNSQDLFYSWVLSTASATAPSDKFFSKLDYTRRARWPFSQIWRIWIGPDPGASISLKKKSFNFGPWLQNALKKILEGIFGRDFFLDSKCSSRYVVCAGFWWFLTTWGPHTPLPNMEGYQNPGSKRWF